MEDGWGQICYVAVHSCQLICTEMWDILAFYCSSTVLNTIAYCFSIVFILLKCGACEELGIVLWGVKGRYRRV